MQVRAWSQTNQLREYLTALAEHIETLRDRKERRSAQAWMSWAPGGSSTDFQRPMAMPSDPDATPENIKPFLNWSGFWGGPLGCRCGGKDGGHLGRSMQPLRSAVAMTDTVRACAHT